MILNILKRLTLWNANKLLYTCLAMGLGAPSFLHAVNYSIYYDHNNPELQTLQFGVEDLISAIERSGNEAETRHISDQADVPGNPGDAFVFDFDSGLAAEEFTIQKSGDTYTCIGGRVGLMYGAFELAEYLGNGNLAAVPTGARTPYLEKRGLKFNIPLDARCQSYADSGSAAVNNIAEVWTMDFWTEQLDSMARNRYNTYTLWSLQPFPVMVKLDDYPDVALDDVMVADVDLVEHNRNYDTDATYDHDVPLDYFEQYEASMRVVKEITIDEKISFWQQVMQYGYDRGIEFHIYTWNVYTQGAGGKHGIVTEKDLEWGADGDPNKTPRGLRDNWGDFVRDRADGYEGGIHEYNILVDYYYDSVTAMLETYPLLAGIGVTSGEGFGDQFNDADSSEKEAFLGETYGEAVADYFEDNPNREFTFVHREHQADDRDIKDAFDRLINDLDNVTFDYSTKYARARLYSYPGYYIRKENVALEDLDGIAEKWWLNLRNDDIFTFRWGDYDYVKEFITWINLDRDGESENGDKPALASIRGFHMGPDGYAMGREFLDKNPTLGENGKRQLEHNKHWMRFMLWGRLGYDLDTPESIFRGEAKRRLGIQHNSTLDLLMDTWKQASKVIPEVNQQEFTNLDYHFHPEYNINRDGNDSRENPLCDFDNFWNSNLDKASTRADTLNAIASEIDAALGALRSRNYSKDYRKTVDDIEAWGHLASFYADWMVAAELGGSSRLDLAEEAARHWEDYTKVAASNNINQVLGRLYGVSFEDIHDRILALVNDLGGDENSLPSVTIDSPSEGPIPTSRYFPIYDDSGSLDVDVSASDEEGGVVRVDLLFNGEVVDTDASLPYRFTNVAIPAGVSILEARAYDAAGSFGTDYFYVFDGNDPDPHPDPDPDPEPDIFSLPWVEDFTLADGTTADSGATSWTSDNGSSGTFEVSNNALLVSNTDGASSLSAGLFDIEGLVVDISLDVESNESLEVDQDYVKLEARVDNGAWYELGSLSGPQAPTTLQASIAGGSLLEVRVDASTSSGAEEYILDNLSLSAESTGVEVAIYSVSEEQSGNEAVNFIDGNPETRWAASGFPQSIVVDYGQSIRFSESSVTTYNSRAYQYTIEVSDSPESGYATVVDRSANTSREQAIYNTFTPAEGRYVRLTVTGASGYGGSWVSLYDLDLGLDTSTPVQSTLYTFDGAGADAYIRGGTRSGNNYGGADSLDLKDSNNLSNTRKVYLAFDLGAAGVIGANVVNAELNLVVESVDTPGAEVAVYGISDDQGHTWTENGITWADASLNNDDLTIDESNAQLLYRGPAVDVNSQLSIHAGELSSFIQTDTDGILGFIIVGIGNRGELVRYHSKESAGVDVAPRLIVEELRP